MEYRYAGRLSNIRASEIRELLKLTERPEVISFAGGLPASELFPIQEIKEVNDYVLDCCGEQALQYTTTEGFQPLRRWIAERMNSRLGTSFDEDNIMITHGSQQALDLTGKVFLEEGDVVLCESPTYLAAISAFRAYGCRFAEVETDEDGMVISRLEKALEENPEAKLIYIVPDFQNPTGRTWSLARRRQLAELSAKYNVVVIEDNPYGELRFEGEPLPPIKSFDQEGVVMYAGTFSKVIAPGMRVGYAIGPKPLFQKMVVCKQGEDVHSNIWAQIVCHRFMTQYDYEAHLKSLQEIYRRKSKNLLDAMEQHLKPLITWNKFEGGLFAWCTLPKEIDMMEFVNKALERHVCVVPGTAFLTDENEPCSSFRINYSTPTDKQVTEGIRILGEIAREMMP